MYSLVINGRTQEGHAHKRADSASGGHGAVPAKEIKKHLLHGLLLEPQGWKKKSKCYFEVIWNNSSEKSLV